MARVNKATDGVFAKIFVGEDNQPTYEGFLETNVPDSPSSTLRKFTKMYKDFISKEKLKLQRIALIEEIIMQMRSRENITDIRISLVNNYIYARIPFYRRDKRVRDVNVIADNREFWKKYSVKKLFSDESFMNKAKEKLTAQMDVVINRNLELLAELDAKLAEAEASVIQKAPKADKAKPKSAPEKTKAPAKPKEKAPAKPQKEVKVAVIPEGEDETL